MPSSSFTISREKKLTAIATAQSWKYKRFLSSGALKHVINLNARLCFVTLPRHLTEPHTFFSGKLKCQWTHHPLPCSMRSNVYLLTLQANCVSICQMRKHNADATTADQLWLFLSCCEKAWKKCWPVARHLQKRDFKTKTDDRVASFKVGNALFKWEIMWTAGLPYLPGVPRLM